jgi:type I site-specific restriction endonuclease
MVGSHRRESKAEPGTGQGGVAGGARLARPVTSSPQAAVAAQAYHQGAPDKEPRFYQEIAINCTIEAIAKGQNRVLLVMATGAGKTLVAFQIIWRLWKAGRNKRILFLADRNILVDQPRSERLQAVRREDDQDRGPQGGTSPTKSTSRSIRR